MDEVAHSEKQGELGKKKTIRVRSEYCKSGELGVPYPTPSSSAAPSIFSSVSSCSTCAGRTKRARTRPALLDQVEEEGIEEQVDKVAHPEKVPELPYPLFPHIPLGPGGPGAQNLPGPPGASRIGGNGRAGG